MLEDTDLVGQTQKLRHTLRSFCLAGQKKKTLTGNSWTPNTILMASYVVGTLNISSMGVLLFSAFIWMVDEDDTEVNVTGEHMMDP